MQSCPAYLFQHILYHPDFTLLFISIPWATAGRIYRVLPPAKAGWCSSFCLSALVWIENDQLVVAASVCTTLQNTTLLFCSENELKGGERVGGMRLDESADSSFPSAVLDRSHWEGRVRQTSGSIIIFTSRMLWPCLLSHQVLTIVSLPHTVCPTFYFHFKDALVSTRSKFCLNLSVHDITGWISEPLEISLTV